jgi:Tfp pilus assembly protein PilE
MNHIREAGFSAVELLITLFIAATFIAGAYQLYSVVIQTGGEARARAKASNIAYDNLRRYSPQATSPCSVVTPSPAPSMPASSGLSNTILAVTFSCPYGTSSAVTKVSVSLRYNTPQQEVVHAIFVTK